MNILEDIIVSALISKKIGNNNGGHSSKLKDDVVSLLREDYFNYGSILEYEVIKNYDSQEGIIGGRQM